MDTVWLDVSMWTGLRGNFHPFTDVACDAPEPLPDESAAWQQWAVANLGAVAQRDGWQPGRYHYSAERRDEKGRTLVVLVRGHWELTT